MANITLTAQSPLSGGTPLTVGDVTMAEAELGTLTSVAPYDGQVKALAEAFEAAHGMPWPGPGEATEQAGARAIWFGYDMALLVGPEPDAALNASAALTEQTDAWATVTLTGAGAEAVLARLVPLDLTHAVFPVGRTARTLIQHMNGSVTRLAPDSFLLMVFRSMAGTLHHDLAKAMESVAARG